MRYLRRFPNNAWFKLDADTALWEVKETLFKPGHGDQGVSMHVDRGFSFDEVVAYRTVEGSGQPLFGLAAICASAFFEAGIVVERAPRPGDFGSHHVLIPREQLWVDDETPTDRLKELILLLNGDPKGTLRYIVRIAKPKKPFDEVPPDDCPDS